MKIVKNLIQLHKALFFGTMAITCFSVFMNLCWNNFLADLLDMLKDTSSFATVGVGTEAFCIILLLAAGEYASSFLAAYTCELFAHEMRMGYARFYLQCEIRTLFELNAGEEQSFMQNELSEVSSYLNENLFSFMKQFISFAFTVVFLLYRNPKLALLSTLPVVPLIIYCSFSSKIIKRYTEQCQESRQQMNGLFGILLDLFPVIQVYKAQSLINTAMNERLVEWQNSNIKKERIAARLMSISGLLSFVPLLLLLGIGGGMVIKGEISIGIFYIFINLSGNVSGFLQNMPNIYAGFRSFSAAVGRMKNKLVF